MGSETPSDKSHDNMSVFYEDREMVIYMIKHTPKSESG